MKKDVEIFLDKFKEKSKFEIEFTELSQKAFCEMRETLEFLTNNQNKWVNNVSDFNKAICWLIDYFNIAQSYVSLAIPEANFVHDGIPGYINDFRRFNKDFNSFMRAHVALNDELGNAQFKLQKLLENKDIRETFKRKFHFREDGIILFINIDKNEFIGKV
jgi:hypothetical protein